MITGPSKHLTWKELACKDGTQYPSEWYSNRAIILAEVFELIRFKCGQRPINILSAYRTAEYNRKVGGVPASQHKYGRALDLRPPSGMNIKTFHTIIMDIANTHLTALKGIGKYDTFIHVDVRPTDNLAKWDYSNGTGNTA